MKALENHILFIDNECPMCRWYSGQFVRAKMVCNETIQHHEEAHKYSGVDFEKSKNKIALLDTKTGLTSYGPDSLVKILSHNFPMIGKMYQWSWVKTLVGILYNFVTYNRKVVAPSAAHYSCQPHFNLKYRGLFIVISIFFVSMVLHQYSQLLYPFIHAGTYLNEFLISAGQTVFQWSFLHSLSRKDKINYLGNLNTVSMIGALLLIPLLIVNLMIPIPATLALVYFGCVAIFMLKEHHRRLRLLQYPAYLSISWIMYRGLILMILL
jgi:hypothetical protein